MVDVGVHGNDIEYDCFLGVCKGIINQNPIAASKYCTQILVVWHCVDTHESRVQTSCVSIC